LPLEQPFPLLQDLALSSFFFLPNNFSRKPIRRHRSAPSGSPLDPGKQGPEPARSY
jgi:hypothetical protein